MDGKHFCYFCEDAENLIQMSTNSLIIDSVYIDFAQLIFDLCQIRINDDPDNMICMACKDKLSEFYSMKQRAKSLHFNSDDIRKSQILEEVSDFLMSIQEDCVLTKHTKLLAIHPTTSSEVFAEELFNCSNILLEHADEFVDDVKGLKEDTIDEIEEVLIKQDPIEVIKEVIIEVVKEDMIMDIKEDMIEEVKEDMIEEEPYMLEVEEEQFTQIEISSLPPKKIYVKKANKVDSTNLSCLKCNAQNFTSQKSLQAHLKCHVKGSKKLNYEKNQRITDPMLIEPEQWVQDQLKTEKIVDEGASGAQSNWTCSICNFSTSKHSSFRNHLTKFHAKVILKGPSKYSCFSCHLRFNGEHHLKVHTNCHRIFEAISPHIQFPSCETCNTYFWNLEDLNTHCNLHKDNPQALLDPIASTGVVHRHGESFALVSDDDVQELLEEDSPTCGHCMKKFSKENDIKIHLMLYHSTVFVCPFDAREFPGIPTLSYGNHLRQFHPDIFFNLEIKCSLCEMKFETVYEKLKHMKNCQAKMLQCDHCERRFFKKNELQHHLKVAMGLMVFACETCGKRCKDQSDLKIHTRSHTNDRPYTCPYCDKSYKTSSARASHVETHMEHQHACEICNVKFRRRILFQRHMKLYHDEKYRAKCFAENTCETCGKSYLQKAHYKNHLKTHG